MLERLKQADNDDDALLIMQALKVINGNKWRSVYNTYAINNEEEKDDEMKEDDNYMSTNEQIEDEIGDANGLLDVILAIVKWLNC